MSPLTATSAPAEAPLLLVRRTWAGRRTLALLLPVAGILVLAAAVAYVHPAARPAVMVLLGLGGLLTLVVLGRIWRTPLPEVARRLNRQYPTLEDSSGLLLRLTPDLNLLEQLQQQRLRARLTELPAAAGLPVDLRGPGLVAGALLLLAGLVWWHGPVAPAAPAPATPQTVAVSFPKAAGPVAVTAPRIEETRLLVTPPAYTRRAAFAPAEPSFRCPQDSRVRWVVRLTKPSAQAPVVELGARKLPMRPVPGSSREFALEQGVAASTLYRIRLGGQVSEDYAIDVQPDQAPTIRILTPKAYTLVEFGRPPQVAVRVQLTDDYGLTRARLVATIAQGQGEAVKFREVATDLSAGLSQQPATATLQHLLRLPALGLTYGDEVYFYLQAWDNRQHLTRSDTYLVQWEDTTVQESALDVSMGVNAKPAYFRSQRQIIIDTEKLLAEQRGLAAATLLERANAIGFDQKVLRMRYGKFLGEEADESIGASTRPPVAEEPAEEPGLGSVVAEDHAEAPAAEEHSENDGHDHSHDHGHAAARGNEAPGAALTAELMDPYIHHHDDAETADFLEPTVKAKLRGVLSEMWEAELRLRTGRPREALPYEYRALRLLKEVQQQTRAYVKKAGFTPPPMPEATTRLTGDLAGAGAPRRQQQLAAPTRQPVVRAALRVLTALEEQHRPPAGAAATLEQAGQELARKALQQPGAYLQALRELRRISTALRAGQPVPAAAVPPAARALTGLLPVPPAEPSRPTGPANRLAQRYFQELSR